MSIPNPACHLTCNNDIVGVVEVTVSEEKISLYLSWVIMDGLLIKLAQDQINGGGN